MYDYYDIPNGQVTGDIAYKYTHRNTNDVKFINFHTNAPLDYKNKEESKRKESLAIKLMKLYGLL